MRSTGPSAQCFDQRPLVTQVICGKLPSRRSMSTNVGWFEIITKR